MSDFNNDGTDKILERVEALSGKVASVDARLNNVLSTVSADYSVSQSAIAKITEEGEKLKGEIRFLSAQMESVCMTLMRSLEKVSAELAEIKNNGIESKMDVDDLSSTVASKIVIPDNAKIDYDELAKRLNGLDIDYDNLGLAVAKNLYIPQAIAEELDYDLLADKVAQRLPQGVAQQNDYDLIAEKVAQAIAVEEISPEDIACRVAEQIVVPTAESAPVTETVVPVMASTVSEENIADLVVKGIIDRIDSEEIADAIAKRVGSIAPEEFEITVDEDGCDSLAKAIESKLDYDALASAVSERISPSILAIAENDNIDSEELANAIAEKLSENPAFNEDALAEKAAGILSNYMPEIDSNEVADKVIAGVIPAIPGSAVVDGDVIADTVSERLLEKQEESDYDIVIDEEGLNRITEVLKQEYDERLDKIDGDIDEIKRLLLTGAVVSTATEETAVTEATAVEEELVTVSDVVGEEQEQEEVAEDEVEIDALIGDLDENPSEGEIMPDGLEGGVDFANMMKYNRSFIARIIQGTDDQKNYYGKVKTALLSYKKVNSNIAWGAERFNKGRETIARFKIRGKTLCLYLALDPAEHPVSVYHHVDVSDNKSMHGTPMMVKIKSPLGVKKAIRLIDEMLSARNGEKRQVAERDYAAMYPYETIEELIDDGLVKDVSKK